MEMHTYESLRTIHGLDAQATIGTGIKRWLRKILRRMEEANRRRRDYEILMGKPEHELRDIGITRADVIAGVRYGRSSVSQAPWG